MFFSMFSARVARTFAASLWLAMGVAGASAQESAAPPVVDFFRRPTFTDAVLSPSGQHLAVSVSGKDGRMRLAVVDLKDMSNTRVVAAYDDADVVGVAWVNDRRLVFRLVDRQQSFDKYHGVGLFSVDREGALKPRMLIRLKYERITDSVSVVDRALQPNHSLHSVLRDGSNDVLILATNFGPGDVRSVNLLRLDTETGRTRGVSDGAPPGAVRWTVDSNGVPRFVTAVDGDKARLFWRTSATSPWTQIGEYAWFGGATPEPLFVDDQDRMFASVAVDGADKASLVVGTVRDNKLALRPLLSVDGFDLEGRLVVRNASVLGVVFDSDAPTTHWFDAGMQKIQAQVDALLPATNNILDCGSCQNPAQVVVRSTSDRLPAAYQLFDVASGKLTVIASSRPWINPKAMAVGDMVRITARDGLSIPVHITRPVGTKAPAPMVVLVHGGPYVRGGTWSWNPIAQFLASRGYVVVEPEFRGSTGFGYKLFRAGWKQWGLAMQDDIADATRWAISQGYADSARVCIAGASYGGYATLMGLIRYPDLYRCGFEWVGVTDIDLLYSNTWSDFGDRWKSYGMPVLIGDRVKDAAQFAATSPVKQASRVKQPLLMAYGGSDRRVPLSHGIQFRDAVREVNDEVEWIVYPEEGHGWTLQSDDVDFWSRVERFLAKNLKGQ